MFIKSFFLLQYVVSQVYKNIIFYSISHFGKKMYICIFKKSCNFTEKMDKSAFNAKMRDMCSYTIQDKADIQLEKTRHPYCVLLQAMDILSDKATGTSHWEERFLPKASLYLFDSSKFFSCLQQVSLADIQTPADIRAKEKVEVAKDKEFNADEQDSFDIMEEINSYQEVAFKTAPKSVILSKFLETGNYKDEDLGEASNISVEDLGKKSVSNSSPLETETLAVIYEKQGKFAQAMEVYRKLIAKNPEKSSTFAIRISELKLKIENNKK